MDDAAAGTGRMTRTSPGGRAGAVRAAPHTPVAPGAPASPRAHRAAKAPRRFRLSLGLIIRSLAALAVALAATTGMLAVMVHGSMAADGQRAAVLAAARQEAVNLTTLDRQHASSDFTAVLAGAAGSLRQQLSQGRGAFLRTLSSADVSSAGLVMDAGIVTMTANSAVVLLNVRATVRNKQTYAPETRVYHWRAALARSGGRWLVTSLVFA